MSECNIPDAETNIFVPGVNSYYDIGKSTAFNLASQLNAGLMSVNDFCKLQSIVIPPPFITLTANKCNTIIKSGIIGIVSGDSYIKVDSSVDIKQNEDGTEPATYQNIPLKIHGNTYGIRFSLDIDRLSAYLIRNGRLILKGTVGGDGEVGDKGPAGIDYVLSGPKGNDGLPGTTPSINLVIQNEDIDVVNVGSTGITDIQTIINTDGTYDLVLTRQPIGDSEVSTNRINVSGVETNWAVVISGPGTNRQVYYLDLEPITLAVFNRATTYSELVKKSYEDAVKFWIKTMNELFDSQKEALCCALDRCRSRIKNDSLRRHFELTSATAKPDYRTTIKTRRDDPVILSSTGILKELYPDGDFCKDPLPRCEMAGGNITTNIDTINCADASVLVDGVIKFDAIEKDVSNNLSLTADVGDVSPATVTKAQLLAGVNITYSCAASSITVTSSGKCVTSINIVLPVIPPPPEPVCIFGNGTLTLEPPGTVPSFTLGKWRFTETSYLPTSLPGATREYTEDNIPSSTPVYGAMWSVQDGGYGLRAQFVDSANCGGPNDYTQFGTAKVDIVSTAKEMILIEWEGIGEAQAANYELMTLKIDGTTIGSGRAPGGNKGCKMGPIISNSSFPNGFELDVGPHEIDIVVNTNDPLYHIGAFYKFTITKANPNTACVPGKQYVGELKFDTLSPDLGPFIITANVGLVAPSTATRSQLLAGLRVEFDCTATVLEVMSNGECTDSVVISIPPPPPSGQKVQKLNVQESEVDEILETQIFLKASENIGYPSNAVVLELPKGIYKVNTVSTDSFVDGKYHSIIRVLTTKGMSFRSMDFVDKGSFDLVCESQAAYENNFIIVDHDGGLLKAYFIGDNDVTNSGSTVLGISVLRLTLNPKQLKSLLPLVKNNIVRVKNIDVDISLDGVNTDVQTSFEFNGTTLVPTKNI